MRNIFDDPDEIPYQQQLRQKAEHLVKSSPSQHKKLTHKQLAEMVHELQVHKIELELQYQELRGVEEQLRDSFERYHSLFETAPIGYFTLDSQGIIHTVNTTFSTLFKRERESVVNRPFADLITQASKKVFYIYMRQAFQHRVFPDLEMQLLRGDGSTFFGLLQANWTSDNEKGNTARMTVTDITPRKKAEIELKKAKDDWEGTFQAVGDAVLILTPQLEVIRANRATSTLTGIPEHEITGKACYTLFRGVEKICDDCPLNSPNTGTTLNCSGEVEHRHLGKIFGVSISPLFSETGKEKGYVCIASDISDKKRIEKELEQSRKMEAIGTLAGGIAHDFNNILGAIIGFSELSQQQLSRGSTEELEENLEAIYKSGIRARDLVSQILTFSRKTSNEKKPLKLRPLFKEFIKLLRPTISTSVSIEDEIDDGDTVIMATPAQIQQIVINLCSNAEHAMRPHGGVLKITLQRKNLETRTSINKTSLAGGAYVSITVSDTGHGMDEETCRRVTEPFFTTKAVNEGTGMGLSLVHGIVSNLGGSLEISSHPGEGTKVTVLLPCITELAKHIEQPAGAATPSKNSSTEGKRILFVDDEEMVCEVGKGILEFLGHQPTICSNSLAALELFKKNPEEYDLLITDQTMPTLPGSELSKKILKITPTLPIILCTGYSSTIDAHQAEQIGIKYFIMKPVSIEALTKAIQEIFPD